MSPLARMSVLCGALLLATKLWVAVKHPGRLRAHQWLAFAIWPGMRPAIFAGLGGPALPGAGGIAWAGCARLALGAVLIALARESSSRLVTALLFYPGASLVLHFGVVNLMAAGWRLAGVDARPLFRAPLLATTLGEFWARRWNLAFTGMAQVCVHRPLAARWGRTAALLATFLFSGLSHEVAISVPVGAGFGGPTLYFALQGAFVLAERRWGLRGHAWTLACLALPFPLLFHPPFLEGVVGPLCSAAWASGIVGSPS